MRLPQPLVESICFLLDSPSQVIQAMGDDCGAKEADEILALFDKGLPPITSLGALSVMLGYNPGFLWSLLTNTQKYYRRFQIKKGQGKREIQAPKVALKIIQKWLAFHLQNVWKTDAHVYGFVRGRSHIDAARKHLTAQWVYSIDIENFFPSITQEVVEKSLHKVGYSSTDSVQLISAICCLEGHLVQGSPSSPVISNIVLNDIDLQLIKISESSDVVYTRYADDIVFSGKVQVDGQVLDEVKATILKSGWAISERKTDFSKLPSRLKVHGLLVHREKLRLTKGYRNKLRAYRHLLKNNKIVADDINKIKGHLNYSTQIQNLE